MNDRSELVIETRSITKEYETANGLYRALNNVSIGIHKGALVAVTGKSGSGKSTLLNIITGIDTPTAGNVVVGNIALDQLSESALATWRGNNVGIVFQFFQLLPTLTIAENVMLPMDFCNTYPKRERRDRALSLLELVGIVEQADKFPSTLSGGQQQRASIARAMANDPLFIVADEPTGNLDSQNAEAIFHLFTQLAENGKTVVVVTHEKDFASYFEQRIHIADGSIVDGALDTGEQKAVTVKR
ncbi:MAG: ABC transporter ATP-binding protein [Bacteroidota bacterium]